MIPFRYFARSSVNCEPAGYVGPMVVLRLVVAVLISFVLVFGALAADRPTLKGDISVNGDVLTLGDLIEGIPAAAAGTALFRAPALGQTGTIQSRRILEAARPLGLSNIETGGRTQVVVTRAARRIAAAEIDAAVRSALQRQHGVDTHALSINFDGTPPSLTVAPEVQGQVTVEDVAFDRRTRRVSALVWIGSTPTERKASLRVSGVAVEYADVAILNRSLNRGETAQASDFVIEKRARDSVPTDALPETQDLAGRVARRTLQAGP